MKLRYLAIVILLLALIPFLPDRENFHPVIEGEIYRSAQLKSERLEEIIASHGLKTVISLRPPRPDEDWYNEEKVAAQSLGVRHHDIALNLTFSPRIDHLLELRDLLIDAPKPLLVHCRAGADRTGLASVMTKLLDGESTLEEARAQVSSKYYAYRDDSLGIPFFNSYTQWLSQAGQDHSAERFNHWLDNEYTDLSGNIHFLVDQIEGQLWERPWGLIEEGHEFDVSGNDSGELVLTGWAFDTRNQLAVESVVPKIGDVRFSNNEYGIHQPWLMEHFPVENYLYSGWKSSHPVSDFSEGCYDLTLEITRTDGSSWVSPPTGRICIDPPSA